MYIYIYRQESHPQFLYHTSNDLILIRISKRKFSCSCEKLSIVGSDPDVTTVATKFIVHSLKLQQVAKR